MSANQIRLQEHPKIGVTSRSFMQSEQGASLKYLHGLQESCLYRVRGVVRYTSRETCFVVFLARDMRLGYWITMSQAPLMY